MNHIAGAENLAMNHLWKAGGYRDNTSSRYVCMRRRETEQTNEGKKKEEEERERERERERGG